MTKTSLSHEEILRQLDLVYQQDRRGLQKSTIKDKEKIVGIFGKKEK
ncbi:hypothetical protein ACQRCX_03880 [Streptococcus sp. SGI.051]